MSDEASESHQRCPRCGSVAVFTEPERCDLDDRPQVLALVCDDCEKRFRVAADDPEGDGVFWQAVAAWCPACTWNDGLGRPYGSREPILCPKCGTVCGVDVD